MARQTKRTDQDPSFRARPDTLNSIERRALIAKPFPVIEGRKICPYPWAGVFIKADALPTNGRRVFAPTPEDEETFAEHFLQD